MTTEEYYDEIQEILDRAAADKGLSTEEYAELLERVADRTVMECAAVRSDLENKKP